MSVYEIGDTTCDECGCYNVKGQMCDECYDEKLDEIIEFIQKLKHNQRDDG